ncbi:hypothetical protein BEWA_054230 [Theileria equi strain WA]|uniref:Uncharacterized protein n=1 Tax=Theileria equi strain WA TaxID=1537102 RepID=L1LD57_THEEQ|nr:hypothetical protein BEWA_054230 [Theileria equi strain WA]EKX73367.1 hypothetical protein BEWA_054230 [Theileria equi strain WA]|eukprot:XP_004832819.1 hypothetical protein BEWA_054230 [Theileria equi strain WA]
MDISNPDITHMQIKLSKVYNLDYGTIHPLDGFVVTRVIDDGDQIWSSQDGEECTLVEHFMGDSASLLALRVENGLDVDFFSFEMDDVGWKSIDIGGFVERISSMLDGVSVESDDG